MKKISDAQAYALRDVREHGNFGFEVRFVTKASVCRRLFVETADKPRSGMGPLRLTPAGHAALRRWH